MRLVRSWPKSPPDNHPRIYDNCERVYIPSVDYSPLSQLDDDVLHLDWDVAVGQDELREFARRCEKDPEIPRVAPIMSYPSRQRRWHPAPNTPRRFMVWTIDMWLHDRRNGLEPGTPYGNLFSFGMVYLPKWTIAQFVEDIKTERWGEQFMDINYGFWYNHVTEHRPVPLEWDMHPVHLNFSMKDTLD